VFAGKEMVLEDNEATLVSLDEVCAYTHRPPGDILALRVPRKLFGAMLMSNVEDYCLRRITRATPALGLLSTYIRTALNGEILAGPDLQHVVASHVHDLMAMMVGAGRDAAEAAQGGGMRAARLAAIKQDIARHLDRPDLSVATLATRHGCTPRFVQRLFETEGTTFTEYVLAQRLVRAHRLLNDPRRAGDKIATIALDAGFSDVSYFNRAFRQLYGDTPSSIRAAHVLN
jgi:AraC-like DNA-binding protein